MKQIIMTIFGFLIFTNSFGQIKLTWESIDIIDETTISVKVFAQNLGQRTALWNKSGNAYYDGLEELNFHVEYDYIPLGTHIVLPPSSITIKTIFGGFISMETPVYYFESTGTESGERWEIVFHQLPRESGNVIVKILGEKRVVGDMLLAAKARKAKMDKFFTEKDTNIFDYKEFYPKDYKSIQVNLENALLAFTKTSKKVIITGAIKYRVGKDGTTSFFSESDNNELNSYLSANIGKYNLQKTEQLGYNLVSEAVFQIFIAKGKSKVKYTDNGNITKMKPNIENEELIKKIKKQINFKGLYRVKFDFISINGDKLQGSKVKAKRIPIAHYLFWGIPALVGIIIGVTIGL